MIFEVELLNFVIYKDIFFFIVVGMFMEFRVYMVWICFFFIESEEKIKVSVCKSIIIKFVVFNVVSKIFLKSFFWFIYSVYCGGLWLVFLCVM